MLVFVGYKVPVPDIFQLLVRNFDRQIGSVMLSTPLESMSTQTLF
jgi:hypothetical protein